MSIEMPTNELQGPKEQLDCGDHIKQCKSNSAKLVVLYLSLKESGASIDKIADEFDMKKINIIPVLEKLNKQGLIDRENNIYTLC